jgi:catalase
MKITNKTSLTAIAVLATLGLSGCTEPTGLKLGEERISPTEPRQAIVMAELIRKVSFDRARERQPLKRFNQVKSQGCFNAEFKINDGLPSHLAQGIFSQSGSYNAYMRFANATQTDDRESDFRGLAIQIDVDDNGQQQDFLFNSHPALFAADPKEFSDFIKAQANDRLAGYFISHLGALKVILSGRKEHDSLFGIDYFSTTPSRHGDAQDRAVKYSVQPCAAEPDYALNRDDENYLRQGMLEHLRQEPGCFNFMVQLQTDPDTMPIEDASVEWPTSESPFVSVAQITINNQNFIDEQAMQRCEQQTFNPWTGIEAHKPLGSINRVRKAIYQQLGEFRNELNQQLKQQG